MKFKNVLIALLIIPCILFSQDYKQTFLSLNNTGVAEFLNTHPEYDGRGTIVFIFDTGVDMGIDGLLKTSTGAVKVIDAQDFTGQGDIKYYEADIDEDNGKSFFINEEQNFKVFGADKISLKAEDDKYYIGLLPEKLWMNSSSGIKDINGNGKEDDKFFFVTFKSKKDSLVQWVIYVDANCDGDVSDELALTNYKDCLTPLIIKNKENLPLLTIAVNIFPEEQKVNFFFDDGSHGTHCAGIAAGYQIGNEFNGVAPGAKIIACKLGNNNYSGGATVTESMKKSYLYADKISKERKEPCIINMSFGVGSVIEGHSDMELFLKELVDNNPYLYICVSNGNEGPGISTTGLPSSSPYVLSNGAILASEVGSDAYGTTLDHDVILHFSSRGGEVLKPDVCSPGAAISTIPNHSGGDRMWGTSMASPYSTGVLSLLLSAAQTDFPDTKIPSLFLYKIVRESASKIAGYNHVDQGGGYINVNSAYELLKKYVKAGEHKNFETYTVTSFAPNMPDQEAPALYIRNGSYLNGSESFSFNISRNNFNKQQKFYRTYSLKSDSEWLVPAQKNIHLRNEQSASVDVSFDISKMQKPGMYNGKIYAFRADKSQTPEFEMMATVVIPYQFTNQNSYTQSWKGVEVAPAAHQRYFLRIPEGTSDIKIKLSSDADKFTRVRYYLHDNNGVDQMSGVFNAGSKEELMEKYYINPEPGVYELVIVGYFTDKLNSVYNLSVDLNGLNRVGSEKLSPENNVVRLVNVFDEVKDYVVSGEINEYQKEFIAKLKSGQIYDYPFIIKKGESKKNFGIKMTKENFNKVTDFAVLIYDENGKVLNSGGLSYETGDINIKNTFDTTETKLKLSIVPAFTNSDDEMTINIKEITTVENAVEIKFNKSKISLFPTSVKDLELKFSKPGFDIPADALPGGTLYFKNSSTGKVETEIPLLFNF
ncbi:MAG: hypothetical protein CVV23_16935 [Ignavibacteriae bacterium HGW-Ignavibacteriae-2]|jgi:subtilisin family serine protease|nr:MAG: hypothetical protein CVV23_16935 [Ignavibacteriae bacterium HGW-Ignavibacteriae-2]